MNDSLTDRPVPPSESIPDADPRVQLATERTLLAWIRTGLALMAFGFVVSRFAFILHHFNVDTPRIFAIQATIIGVVLVALGVAINVAAPLHYRNYYRRVRSSNATQFAAWSLTVFVALSLAVIGAVLAVYLLVVDLAV